MSIVFANLLVFVVAAFFLYMRFRKTFRLNSLYAMYEIRDQLVYLVACGKLKENSKVFSYYYKSVNGLLQEAPSVGLDDIIQVIYADKKNGDFETNFDAAKRKTKSILEQPEMDDADVKCAVENFYKALSKLIIAHSSFLKVVYLVGLHGLLSFLPKNSLVARSNKIVTFAEYEARHLHGGNCCTI